MELKNRNYIMLDLETTGFDEKKHQILEVGILIVKGLEVFDELELKIKHKDYVLSTSAMKANKIDLISHEEEAVEPKEAAEKILEFLSENKSEEEEGYIVIGQNVEFDIRFIETLFLSLYKIKDFRKLVSYRKLDIMQLALIKSLEGKIELEKQDLDHVLNKLNIEIPEGRHRALADCYIQFEAMRGLLDL